MGFNLYHLHLLTNEEVKVLPELVWEWWEVDDLDPAFVEQHRDYLYWTDRFYYEDKTLCYDRQVIPYKTVGNLRKCNTKEYDEIYYPKNWEYWEYHLLIAPNDRVFLESLLPLIKEQDHDEFERTFIGRFIKGKSILWNCY